MFWIILIGLFVLGYLFTFFKDLKKDDDDLQSTSLDEKFDIIVNMINIESFGGKGRVTMIDKREFNLYENRENQLIKFHYSTGHLTITWMYKYFQKEIVHERQFNDVRNLSVFEQQKIGKEMIREMSNRIKHHKKDVMGTISDEKDNNQYKLEKEPVEYYIDLDDFDPFGDVQKPDKPIKNNHIINVISEVTIKTLLRLDVKLWIEDGKCMYEDELEGVKEEFKPLHIKKLRKKLNLQDYGTTPEEVHLNIKSRIFKIESTISTKINPSQNIKDEFIEIKNDYSNDTKKNKNIGVNNKIIEKTDRVKMNLKGNVYSTTTYHPIFLTDVELFNKEVYDLSDVEIKNLSGDNYVEDKMILFNKNGNIISEISYDYDGYPKERNDIKFDDNGIKKEKIHYKPSDDFNNWILVESESFNSNGKSISKLSQKNDPEKSKGMSEKNSENHVDHKYDDEGNVVEENHFELGVLVYTHFTKYTYDINSNWIKKFEHGSDDPSFHDITIRKIVLY